jgi:acyl carrier protein
MDTRRDIRAFIVQNFFVADEGALGDDDLLLEAGVVDSTGVLEIIRFLEEQYAITLNDEEILPENLGSISRIADFVARRTGAARGSGG